MKKFLTLLFLLCSTLSFTYADVINYGCKGKLGTSISYKLEFQQNNIGAIAGATTYYRKNGKVSTIPVFGYAKTDEQGEVTIYLQEYDHNKICGYFIIKAADEQIKSGYWTLGEKNLQMNELELIDLPLGTRFMHPVTSLEKALGEYSFTYDSGNKSNPEYGGHCTLTSAGKELSWEICQVTPNIAEVHSQGEFAYASFTGEYSNFKYEGYVDEKFVYVYQTNPEAGACEDFGAWATIEGIYVRKGAAKPTLTDLMMCEGNVDAGVISYMHENYYENAAGALQNMWHSEDETLCQSVKKLLLAAPLPITGDELTTFTKVRSTQLNDLGIVQYNYFNCRFAWEMRAMNFKKSAGSQRRAGGIYRLDDNYLIMQGCWFIGGDPIIYDDAHASVGLVKKVAADKILMLFSNGEQGFELYEFKKQ